MAAERAIYEAQAQDVPEHVRASGRSRASSPSTSSEICLLDQEYVRDQGEKKPRTIEELRVEVAGRASARTSPSGDSRCSSLASSPEPATPPGRTAGPGGSVFRRVRAEALRRGADGRRALRHRPGARSPPSRARCSDAHERGVEVAIVVGRRQHLPRPAGRRAIGMDRATADYMGMIATDAERPGDPGRAGEARA